MNPANPNDKVPIGGGHALPGLYTRPPSGAGGVVQVQEYGDIKPLYLLDVGQWAFQEVFQRKVLECSGQLGATDNRLIGYEYLFALEVIWDYRKPPDIILRARDGVKLWLDIGQVPNPAVAEGGDSTGAFKERYYWAPRATLLTASPVVQAANKKVLRQTVTGRSRGHVFLIPDMGTPDDQSTIAGAYNKFLSEHWPFRER